jgi:glycosyltransferase involved in cell wall biosynthesis
MMLSYSLIIPYYRTPEITRIALYSIFKFCRGNAEVIAVDNDPDGGESKMLDEFPRIKRINNRTKQRGSAANFEALDIGLQHASHDLVGLLHSDTIFLQDGWDLEWFGCLERKNLAALSTFEREANPFRSLRKQIGDRWRHLRHNPRPTSADAGKLMFFWLLTRKSVLQALNFVFLRDGHITPDRLVGQRNGLEVLSCVQISRFMWHTSNITSILSGR